MYEHMVGGDTELPSTDELDNLSLDGWELVCIAPRDEGGVYVSYYRRQRRTDAVVITGAASGATGEVSEHNQT